MLNTKIQKTRNEICDKEMLKELDGILNPSLREKVDRSIVRNLINAKVNLGLGVAVKKSSKMGRSTGRRTT